jgi:hypothetical protein
VFGGWIVGAMLLAVMVGAAMVLDHSPTPRQPRPGTELRGRDHGVQELVGVDDQVAAQETG